MPAEGEGGRVRLCYAFVSLGGEPSSGWPAREKRKNPEVFNVLFSNYQYALEIKAGSPKLEFPKPLLANVV